MAWKIRNQVSGKILPMEFNTEGEGWAWLGLGVDPDLNEDDFNIFDDSKVQELRSEGAVLADETNQLVEQPYLKDEDMTFGEKVASFAMPITTEVARRGASDKSIYGSALGESALMGAAGPLIGGANALGTKLGLAGLSKVAGPATATALRSAPKIAGGLSKLVAEMGLGGIYGGALAKAQDRDIERKDVAIGAAASLLPLGIIKGLQKTPSMVRGVTGSLAGGKNGMSGLTGVGSEPLEAWGGGFGPRAKAMKDISGKSIQTRDDLFRQIDGPMPESVIVNEALSGVDVDLNPLVAKMKQKSEAFGVLPSEQSAKAELDKLIIAIEQYGDLSAIPAQEARKLRQEFERQLSFNDTAFEKATLNKLNPVLKDLRYDLKQTLENVAGTQSTQAENRAINQANKLEQSRYLAEVSDIEAQNLAEKSRYSADLEGYDLAKKNAREQAEAEVNAQIAIAKDPTARNVYVPGQKTSKESVSRLQGIQDMKKLGPSYLGHIEDPAINELEKEIIGNIPKPKLTEVALPKLPKDPVKPKILDKKGYVGDPKYKQAMADWSVKIDAKERVVDILGKTDKQRSKRWGSFLNTFTNSNKEYQQQVLADFDKVFGSEFSQKLRDLVNIEKLGLQSGKAPWLTRRATGEGKALQIAALASGLSGIGAPIAVTSSPKLASGVLGLAGLADKAVNSSKFNYGAGLFDRFGALPSSSVVGRNIYSAEDKQ